MTRLPEPADFDPTAFPELAEIFLDIDAAIAAIVAADPSMRPRQAQKRRSRRTARAGMELSHRAAA
jgi:hypothetical protein